MLTVDLSPRSYSSCFERRRYRYLSVRLRFAIISITELVLMQAVFFSSHSFDGSMRQEKREQVIKAFTAPNKDAVAGSKADKKSPMVMLLSLKVRSWRSSTDQSARADCRCFLVSLTGWSSRFELDHR